MYFEKSAAVARLSPNADNSSKESYVTLLPNIRINIQPASASITAVAEGVYGETFKAFVSVSGIQIGDRITVSGVGDKYIVKGTDDWNYGPLPHTELVLFKEI